MDCIKTMKLDEVIKDVNVEREKEEKGTKITLGYSNIEIFWSNEEPEKETEMFNEIENPKVCGVLNTN